MTRHLDGDLLRRLGAGTLAAEEGRALAAHLESGCPACEDFLAGARADLLDGSVDQALLSIAPAAGEPGSDLEFARLRRRLGRRVPRLPVAAGALAAAVLAAGLAGLFLPRGAGREPAPGREPWQSLKGADVPAAVRLRFSVALPGPAGPSIGRGASGAVLPPEAGLLFRAETDRPLDLALLRAGPDGTEVIWRDRAPAPGTRDVEVGGRPALYPLGGLSGLQRFVLVAAPSLSPEQVEEARRLLAGGRSSAAPGRSASMDGVEVTVR